MKIINKKASFEYELFDRLETGIMLTGAEVKSAKSGHVSLSEAYVRILQNQLFLINATISPYKFAANPDYQPQRTRKLLAKKNEILALVKKIEAKNLTLVPVALYTKNNRLKLEIALARGKKEYEKREKKKRDDLEREKQKILKNFNK
jgi:SsrA-binding protein